MLVYQRVITMVPWVSFVKLPGFIGRLDAQKGYDLLLESLVEVLEVRRTVERNGGFFDLLWRFIVMNGDLMVINGDLMVINGDLMVINGDLMVINGDLMVINGDELTWVINDYSD